MLLILEFVNVAECGYRSVLCGYVFFEETLEKYRIRDFLSQSSSTWRVSFLKTALKQ